MNTDNRVDAYLANHPQWREQFLAFREILLATQLTETIKWGIPAYTLDSSILIGFAGFKQHCAVWFHQGVFLRDEAGKLTNAQEGRTQAMRQWRFVAGDKVPGDLFRAYVDETIANHRAGKAKKPASRELVIPQELAQAMQDDEALRQAFDQLTPGRQKEYAEHIGSAKQEKTRLARLEKAIPLILAGGGLHDKYKR